MHRKIIALWFGVGGLCLLVLLVAGVWINRGVAGRAAEQRHEAEAAAAAARANSPEEIARRRRIEAEAVQRGERVRQELGIDQMMERDAAARRAAKAEYQRIQQEIIDDARRTSNSK